MMLKSLKRFRSNLSEKLTGSKSKQLSVIRDAIAKALSVGVPFAAYSLPGETMPVFFADTKSGCSHQSNGDTISCCNHNDNYDTEFSITPWQLAESVSVRSVVGPREFLANDIGSRPLLCQPLQPSTSYMAYLDRVEDLIAELKKSGGKCVISRIESYSDPFFDVTLMADAFMRAVEKYPLLMVCIFYTPQTGCWLTATPESLLESNGQSFSTMALAGTLPVVSSSQWDEKNILEHEVVVDEIARRLSSLGLKYDVSEKGTLIAGSNMHLLTRFCGQRGSLAPDTIAQALHPTPAIAGYPLDDALTQIKRVEQHQRRCYGGTITLKSGASFKSFVTLRCVEFSPEGYAFYGGGGITPYSVPSEEWVETARKISTIASVMPGAVDQQ